MSAERQWKVCDGIGTGSGCICRLLKTRFKRVVATDIDLNAIKQAKDKVDGVTFVCCDSSSAISNIRFDLIVMNPPYLPSDEIKDVTVDGGRDGIEISMRMVMDSTTFAFQWQNLDRCFIASKLQHADRKIARTGS